MTIEWKEISNNNSHSYIYESDSKDKLEVYYDQEFFNNGWRYSIEAYNIKFNAQSTDFFRTPEEAQEACIKTIKKLVEKGVL